MTEASAANLTTAPDNAAPEVAMTSEPPLKVFEPKDARQTLQGWALHATRRRLIHEHEARRLDRLRYVLGTVATCLAAAAGTSAFAGWQSSGTSTVGATVTAAVGVGAAVLGSIMTFLDPGGRAEAHRRSAVEYKGVIRVFEAACGAGATQQPDSSKALLLQLERLLTEVDGNALTVPLKRANEVEGRQFCFTETAIELGANQLKDGGG